MVNQCKAQNRFRLTRIWSLPELWIHNSDLIWTRSCLTCVFPEPVVIILGSTRIQPESEFHSGFNWTWTEPSNWGLNQVRCTKTFRLPETDLTWTWNFGFSSGSGQSRKWNSGSGYIQVGSNKVKLKPDPNSFTFFHVRWGLWSGLEVVLTANTEYIFSII